MWLEIFINRVWETYDPSEVAFGCPDLKLLLLWQIDILNFAVETVICSLKAVAEQRGVETRD